MADVGKDIVANKDSFFGNYYAAFANKDVEKKYTNGWKSGVSPVMFFTDQKGELLTEFQLKYYPSRAGGIGVDLTGFNHVLEAIYEGTDGLIREVTGNDNVFYDMHGLNAWNFLNLYHSNNPCYYLPK